MCPFIQAEQTWAKVLQPKQTDAQRTAGVRNKMSKVPKCRMWVREGDLDLEPHAWRRRQESQWGEVIGLCRFGMTRALICTLKKVFPKKYNQHHHKVDRSSGPTGAFVGSDVNHAQLCVVWVAQMYFLKPFCRRKVEIWGLRRQSACQQNITLGHNVTSVRLNVFTPVLPCSQLLSDCNPITAKTL